MISTELKRRHDAMIDRHFRYEAEDDVAGVLATMVDEVDHDIVGYPTGPVRGHAAARRFYERMFADLAGEKVTTLRRFYGEDFVIDESLWEGTAPGTPFGLPGQGRRLAFRLLHLFEMAPDGRIARENVWLDLAAIQQQLADAPPAALEQAA